MTTKTIISGVLATVVAVGAIGGYFYLRTKQYETCETALTRFQENHLCIATNKGTMVFELYSDAAPKAVAQMKKLSNEKQFFNDLEFYRVVRDFVIQGGIQEYRIDNDGVSNLDPIMEEKIRLSDEKFDVESDFDKLNLTETERAALEEDKAVSTPGLSTRVFEQGSIAFANSGPGTNSTEIFIVTSNDKDSTNVRYLNGRFTNFGKIVEGLTVLNVLNELGEKGADGRPVEKIQIIETRVK